MTSESSASEGGGGRRLPAADLARVAVFAALIGALGLPGQLTLFGSPVPITAQSLGVMLAGALLGAWRAFLACLTFCAVVIAGLPLLAGGLGGLAALTSPRTGFFLGFPVAALVIGWLTERLLPLPRYRFWPGFLAAVLGGIVVLYLCGIPVMVWRTDTGLFGTVASLVQYVPGDLLKATVTALVARQVYRAYPELVGRGGRA